VTRYRRLKPQQRREQLLDTAAVMFAERTYEDVWVGDIAARAGVSRATMYHYFPSKRDLYVAILKRASGRFSARAQLDAKLPLAQHLAAGLQAHIQSLVDHPFEAVAINRGALSDDPEIQAIIADELSLAGRLLTDRLVAQGCLRDATEIAVEGWLAFVRAACVKWIQSQSISRDDLTEMCLRAFDCALDIPAPPGRMRARTYGVMQRPAITSLIRKSPRATSARVPGRATGYDTTRLAALLNARTLFTNRKGS
jgi:AcrR family transcriptional regulator